MKQPVFLRVYLNGKLENVKQFTEEQIVIGRNADLQLTLHDDAVSPLHAVIEERDSGYYVSDLGSQNGTLKNGQKVFDEKIESGEELQVGPYKLEFFIGVPKPKQAPKPAVSAVDLQPVVPPAAPLDKPAAMPLPDDLPPAVKEETTGFVFAPQRPKVDEPKGAPVQKKKIGDSDANVQSFASRMKSSKGSIVEVVVTWKDRVLTTSHYSQEGEVFIGGDSASDIQVPLIGVPRVKHKLLKLGPGVRIFVSAEMSGDYYRDEIKSSLAELKRMNRMIPAEGGFEFDLLQGEMVRIGLHGDVLNIFIRFIPEVPKPLAAPFLDLTSSETASVVMSVLVAGFFALYMTLHTPSSLDGKDQLVEEPIRRATVTFTPPKIVQVEDSPKQEKQVVQVTEKKAAQAQTTKKDPGRASAPRPSERVANKGEVASAIKQGGAMKTSDKPAANMKTKDINATGLLSVFGGRGTQTELNKATSGAGELVGEAESATGAAGGNETRAGDSLGGRLKNVGGGKGASTVGIGGVGTQGRGTGPSGLGTGGLGQKGNVDINIEGAEASFTGSIDKEAIRRVIRENRKLFQYCYDQALRRNSDAYGKVEIQWDIEERGRATNAIVKSNSTGDSAFGRCMADKIRGLIFPEPPADQIARVVFPFVFTAQ